MNWRGMGVIDSAEGGSVILMIDSSTGGSAIFIILRLPSRRAGTLGAPRYDGGGEEGFEITDFTFHIAVRLLVINS